MRLRDPAVPRRFTGRKAAIRLPCGSSIPLKDETYKSPRRQGTMPKRILVLPGDTLRYQDKEVSTEVLGAVLNTKARLLWAFIENDNGDVQAVAYDESHVLWLAREDLHREQDVEV
jgi:hypothetical protein